MTSLCINFRIFHKERNKTKANKLFGTAEHKISNAMLSGSSSCDPVLWIAYDLSFPILRVSIIVNYMLGKTVRCIQCFSYSLFLGLAYTGCIERAILPYSQPASESRYIPPLCIYRRAFALFAKHVWREFSGTFVTDETLSGIQ